MKNAIAIVSCVAAWSCASTAAAGCVKDMDCKGDRICVNGKCVWPDAAPPQPVPEPAVQPAPAPSYAPYAAAPQPEYAPSGPSFAEPAADSDGPRFNLEGPRFELYGGGFTMFGEGRGMRGCATLALGWGFESGLIIELYSGWMDYWQDRSDDYAGSAVFPIPILIGARYRFLRERVRPWVGLHVGVVEVVPVDSYEVNAFSTDNIDIPSKAGFGLMASAGLELMLVRGLFLNLAAGVLVSVANLPEPNWQNKTYESGAGLHFGLGLGYQWSTE